MLDKIAIIGYSGHDFVVTESAISNGINILYYCEKLPNNINPIKLKYLGFEGDDDFKSWGNNIHFILGIGDNMLRHKIGKEILNRNKTILNIIDSARSLSKHGAEADTIKNDLDHQTIVGNPGRVL